MSSLCHELKFESRYQKICHIVLPEPNESQIGCQKLVYSRRFDDKKPYFLARAFMSQNQEVRVLMRPPIWSALPLFGSGTKTRMRVPAVMPRTGDT